MWSLIKDHDRVRFVLIGILCSAIVCVVIALCIQLMDSSKVEEIAMDELLQQYWEEQALITANSEDTKPVKETASAIDLPEEKAMQLVIENQSNASANEDSNNAQKIGDDSIKHDEHSIISADESSETQVNDLSETIGETAVVDGKIDINRATVEQLQQLKGIGPSKAKAIVEDREQKGSFRSIADIKRVKGIGEKLYEGIQESIVAIP